MASWMRSPLRPLLNEATKDIDQEELMAIADNIKTTTEAVLDLPTARADLEKANGNTEEWASPEIEDSLRRVDDHVDKPIRRLADDIASRLESMVGISQALQTVLGFSPTEPDRLLRSIRLLIDAGKRNVSDASLGSANLLYLTLKSLELDQLAKSGQRDHTFLAIEEPEAHLHPHLQRLVYRDFLRRRLHQEMNTEQEPDSDRRQTVLLTTHSPHIVSVAPLRSIVLLKRSTDGEHTVGASATNVDLSCNEEHDIERYLDVNRGEILFARAVILVEGSAEEYLVPAFGKLLGHDFDELGISVCSVSGTNFTPYVRLLGRNGFQIPFAVLTDYDPRDDGKPLGVSRVLSLLGEMMEREEYDALSADDERLARAPELGVFLNQHTLEVDLFESGCCRSMCKTLIELADNDDAKRRALGWCRDSNSLDKPRFLKDIGVIGKGRFAQRLAGRIKADGCPAYIKEAVEYAAARCG
jgi:putative ATP-dependent endonuclease of OLD family